MGSIPEMSILKGAKCAVETQKLQLVFQDRLRGSAQPEDTAIIFQENGTTKQLSYSQLNAEANKIARVILNRVNRQNQSPNSDGDFIVAVSMQPTDRLLITLLGIWKSGAAYLPLDPSFPEQRVKHILGESKPVLVVHDELADTESFEGVQFISYSALSKEAVNEQSENIPEVEYLQQTTENLAIVLYTSGSTGIPKGVRLPHHVIQNRLQWQYSTFPFSETERVCVFKTALTFVDSVCELWAPLLKGLTVLVVPKDVTRDPQKLVKLLTDYKIERLVLVPSLLRSLLLYLSLNKNPQALSTLRLWVSSGETLPVSLAEEFFQHFKGRQLCNFYGSTEVMADVTYFCVTDISQLNGMDKVPIGNPMNNTIIYLLDSNLQAVSRGQVGELWVAGRSLSAGYVSGRSPDSFVANPAAPSQDYSRMYRTGDFAMVEKGTLTYQGRTDSQIKIRGHRVDLTEVEKAVITVKGIDKGVVLCYKPGEMDQALLAFVTCHAESKLTGLQLESKLQDKLAAYMVPQVIILDNIPLLVNGKNDRQALLKMYENTNNNDDAAIALDIDYSGIPASKMAAAEVLFQTVGSVIGRSTRASLTVHSNYYSLGGNSLNSIFTITKLKEQGYEIGITDFIMAQDLGEILEKITTDPENVHHKEPTKYVMEPLEDRHKSDVIMMVVESFYEKADLERWLKPAIQKQDYRQLLEQVWPKLVELGLSFIVRAEDGSPCGVTLSLDARDEPDLEVSADLSVIFEFLEYVEGPIRDNHLPMGLGQILHSYMMATDPALSAQENVAVITCMETEIVKIGRNHGFAGILTTNTSPLTMQLSTDVMNYETLLEYQVNKYVSSSGTTPFIKAPDSQTVMVCWKQLK